MHFQTNGAKSIINLNKLMRQEKTIKQKESVIPKIFQEVDFVDKTMRPRLIQLLTKYDNVFAYRLSDLGRTHIPKHQIETTDETVTCTEQHFLENP